MENKLKAMLEIDWDELETRTYVLDCDIQTARAEFNTKMNIISSQILANTKLVEDLQCKLNDDDKNSNVKG